MSDEKTIIVTFAPKGDEDVLGAIKKVTRHVDDLKRIAKTPIDLDIVKGSMDPQSFQRLVDTVNKAKEATAGLGKETAKAGQEAAKAAKEAQKFAESMANMGKGKTIDNSRLTGSNFATGAGGVSPAVQSSLAGLKKVDDEIRRIKQLASTPIELKLYRSSLGDAEYNKMSAAVMNARKQVAEMGAQVAKTEPKVKSFGESIGFVGRIIAAMAIRNAIHEIYEMANAYTAFQNKIKTVLKDQSDLNFITKDLISIAQRSRSSMEAVGTVFTRTSRAVESLGKSQFQTLKFTETLTKAVAVGGSTSIEAKNAMIQLSQGMSSGTLKGDELRSVLEQLPIVAQLIADKMGVTVGQLRKLGSEGKLTTDVVFDAIIGATDKINRQFEKMNPTMEQIVGVIKDKFMVAIGQSTGLVGSLTKALEFLSNNFDVAYKAAEALATVMATFMTGRLITLIASIGTGWLGVAAAVTTAVVAVTAFSDKIAMSDDGVMKLNRATEAFTTTLKKDFGEWVRAVEIIIDKIAGLPVKFSFSLDKMVDRLATIQDMLRTMARPDMLIKGLAGNKEALKWAGRTQREVRAQRAAAIGDQKDAFWQQQKDREAKFNAMIKGNLPNMDGSTPTTSKKEGTKESGKTFEELIREATFQEGVSRLDDLEEKIRERLHRMTESLKPSIKAALDDMGGDKQIAALNKAFNKEHSKEKYLLDPVRMEQDKKRLDQQIAGIRAGNSHLIKQAELLEETVRIEMTRDFYAKEKVKQEKEAEKLLEENLKKMKAQEEAARKLTLERQKHLVSEVKAKREREEALADELDPTRGTTRKIQELEAFIKEYKDFPEWTERARYQVDLLNESLATNGATLDFISQYKSIWGQGGTMVKGFSDIAAKVLVMNLSLRETKNLFRDLATTLQQQALSALFQLGINSAIGALGNVINPSPGALPGGVTGPNGKPTTIDVVGSYNSSDYNLGNAGIDTNAGISSADAAARLDAMGMGHAAGGYTGNYGTDQIAGVVHGQEYVLNADATRRMGRENLDTINKGGAIAAPKMEPKVSVHNYAGVQVETGVSAGEVQIMITKAMKEKMPQVMAQSINNPSSPVSRSLSKNLTSERRRI